MIESNKETAETNDIRLQIIARLKNSIHECHEDAQTEIGALLALLQCLSPTNDRLAIESIDAMLTGLLLAKPNVVASRKLRCELEQRLLKRRFPLRARIFGGSAAVFVALGMLAVILFGIVMLYPQYSIWTGIWNYLGFANDEHIITLVGLSGAVGSIVSMLLRIQTFAENVDGEGWKGDPWVLFLTGFSKPLVGIFAAWFAFALYRAGLIPLSIKEGSDAYWFGALAFLSGFAERLFIDVSSNVAKKLVGTSSK